MHFSSITYLNLTLLIGILALSGCPDKKEPFREGARPEWSYDKPFYQLPEEPAASVTTDETETPVTYLNERKLVISRPKVGDDREAPRIASWLTCDHGMTWERIGYFGLQQPTYYHPVKEDGEYGVRFVGPGIAPAECKPPKPHITYVVDTQNPEISVFLSPNKEVYHAGDQIMVEWVVDDPNIEEDSVEIGICMDSEAAEFDWAPLGQKHPQFGKVSMVIPDQAIDKSMMIRVTARDKAGNLGFGYSCEVPVVYEPISTQPAATQNAQDGPNVEITSQGPKVLTTMPEEYPDLEE